jgi:hypothetical protein
VARLLVLTQPGQQVCRIIDLLHGQFGRLLFRGPITEESDIDDHKGKLSLRCHPVHRRETACDSDPLHLLVCSKRGALCAYQEAEEDFVLTTARDRVSTYQWGSYQIEHHHCAICGSGTWSRSPLWDQDTKRPVPGKFRVQVNAWLLEDFDPTHSRLK